MCLNLPKKERGWGGIQHKSQDTSRHNTARWMYLQRSTRFFSYPGMLIRVKKKKNQYRQKCKTTVYFLHTMSAQMLNDFEIWVFAICPISTTFIFFLEVNTHLKSLAAKSLASPAQGILYMNG